MKHALARILRIASRWTLKRYTPVVIAVTGSVGKTSTKETLYAVFAHTRHTRKSEGNFNTDIGVPLTVLGIANHGKNVFGWFGAFVSVAHKLVIHDPNYPKILILEMGADRPGDIALLARIAPPFIGIITAVGDIPVHVEFFAGPADVAREKSAIIAPLPPEGAAITNADDATLDDIRARTRARRMTFGYDEHATVRIERIEYALDYDTAAQHSIPLGTRVFLSSEGDAASATIRHTFGKPIAYAAAAAACAGIHMGIPLSAIAKALELTDPPPGRLRLISGIKNSFILDDTYNSSPQALHAALDTLRDLPGKRKIAILGDMLELGEYTELAHRVAGERVARYADILITVGPRARFIAEEAMRGGLDRTRMLPQNNVYSFDTASDAARAVDAIIEEGDLALVKGSQAMRMERIVEEMMADPLHASSLLVRQSAEWKKRP